MNVKTMQDFLNLELDEAGAAAAQFEKDGRKALARLVKLAVEGTGGQSRRVGNFLLAWWNANQQGGFDFTHFWNVDESIARDMMTATAFLALSRRYADDFGHQAAMEKVVELYGLKKRRKSG